MAFTLTKLMTSFQSAFKSDSGAIRNTTITLIVFGIWHERGRSKRRLISSSVQQMDSHFVRAVSLSFQPCFCSLWLYFFTTDFGILYVGAVIMKNAKDEALSDSAVFYSLAGLSARASCIFSVFCPALCGFSGPCCNEIILYALFSKEQRRSWSVLQKRRNCRSKPITRTKARTHKQLHCCYSTMHWLSRLFRCLFSDTVFSEKSALYQVLIPTKSSSPKQRRGIQRKHGEARTRARQKTSGFVLCHNAAKESPRPTQKRLSKSHQSRWINLTKRFLLLRTTSSFKHKQQLRRSR